MENARTVAQYNTEKGKLEQMKKSDDRRTVTIGSDSISSDGRAMFDRDLNMMLNKKDDNKSDDVSSYTKKSKGSAGSGKSSKTTTSKKMNGKIGIDLT
jgi:hypothetical protein